MQHVAEIKGGGPSDRFMAIKAGDWEMEYMDGIRELDSRAVICTYIPNTSEYPVFLESMGVELEGSPFGWPNGTSILT